MLPHDSLMSSLNTGYLATSTEQYNKENKATLLIIITVIHYIQPRHSYSTACSSLYKWSNQKHLIPGLYAKLS